MALETATYINDLVVTNPVAGDDIAQGDDHLRMIKDVLKNTFPGVTASFFALSHTFTANLTIAHSGDATLTLRQETSATGTTSRLLMEGNDSVGNDTIYAELRGGIVDSTDASEDGEWGLLASIAGTLTFTLRGQAGVFTPNATGGDKGADTINATTLHEAGISLSAKYSQLGSANIFTAKNTFNAVVEVGTFSTTGASRGQQLSAGAGTEQLRRSSTDTTANTTHEQFWDPSGTVGSIVTAAGATSYNTTSDGNLKDAVIDADKAAAVAKLKAGRPVEFEFKNEPGVKHHGFIAQEMHLVHPEAVTPGDAETPWMIDHSKLVPILWATVQAHEERIDVLEATIITLISRIEALEAA